MSDLTGAYNQNPSYALYAGKPDRANDVSERGTALSYPDHVEEELDATSSPSDDEAFATTRFNSIIQSTRNWLITSGLLVIDEQHPAPQFYEVLKSVEQDILPDLHKLGHP